MNSWYSFETTTDTSFIRRPSPKGFFLFRYTWTISHISQLPVSSPAHSSHTSQDSSSLRSNRGVPSEDLAFSISADFINNACIEVMAVVREPVRIIRLASNYTHLYGCDTLAAAHQQQQLFDWGMNKHIISSHREAADSVVITFGVRVMDYTMTSAYKTLLLHQSTRPDQRGT